MENSIDMYYFPASPPTRAVLMLARALGLMMNLKLVNIMEGEQMKPEFLKVKKYSAKASKIKPNLS